jgi:glycerate-2-kinase
MSSAAIKDLVEMVEALPSQVQEQVVEHLREYIADLQDEQQWDASFSRTQSALVAAARQAKQERAAGKATVMDYEQL